MRFYRKKWKWLRRTYRLCIYIHLLQSLLVYAVQSSNEKIEILYTVVNDVVGKIQGPVEIEGTIPGKADYDTQVFT